MIRTTRALVYALLFALLLAIATAPRLGLTQDGGAGITAATPTAGTASVGGPGVGLLPEGKDGEVGVVLWGEYREGALPIVVRNTTDAAVAWVIVRASARDAAGEEIARETTLVPLAPGVVEPGGYALTSIFFTNLAFEEIANGDAGVLDGATFAFEVTYDEVLPPGERIFLDLAVEEAAHREDRADILLANRNPDAVHGPLQWYLGCLGEDGALLEVRSGQEYPEPEAIPPGGTLRLDLPADGCPRFVVTASGTRA